MSITQMVLSNTCLEKAVPRVLVVEDDPMVSAYLETSLQLSEYDARSSANGLEGLQTIEDWQPDLLILDLDMPVMSGYRLLGLLRRDQADEAARIPVVVMTGHDVEEAMDVVTKTKPEAYLTKPIQWGSLLERVRELAGEGGPD